MQSRVLEHELERNTGVGKRDQKMFTDRGGVIPLIDQLTPAKLIDTTELSPPAALRPGHNVVPVTSSTPTTFVLVWISTLGSTGGKSRSDISELTLQTAVQFK